MSSDQQQVLEVVFAQLVDAKTLLKCSMLSRHFQHITQQTVHMRLAELVTASSFTNGSSDNCAIKWLCRLAGPEAVNSYAAGCAVLDKVMRMPEEVARLMLATGLRLTNNLLVHLAEKGMRYMSIVVSRLVASRVPNSADSIYMRIASGNEHIPRDVTAANFGDLLTIAAQVGAWHSDALAAVTALLDWDKDGLHVLHPDSASAGAGASSASASTAQQTMKDAVRLVVQLLSACRGRDALVLCERTVALPATQHIGKMDLQRLVQQAVTTVCNVLGPEMPYEVLEKIASLPGARDVSTNCVSELIALCINCRRYSHGGPLLQLPSAKQLPSKQLCKLVGMAGTAGQEALVRELGRLANGRELEAEHVLDLLKRCISKPWPCKPFLAQWLGGTRADLADCLVWLESLKPGRHLSGDHILDLFEFCSADRLRHSSWHQVRLLQPAAAQIKDLARFKTCIAAAVANSNSKHDVGIVLKELPISQQLQVQDWVELLPQLLNKKTPNSTRLPADMDATDFPVLQQMGVQDLQQLLEVVTHPVSRHTAVAFLCGLPAAQELPPAALSRVLRSHLRQVQTGGQNGDVLQAIQVLLALPAARQMPEAEAQQLREAADATNDVELSEGFHEKLAAGIVG